MNTWSIHMWRATPPETTPNPCIECNRHVKFGKLHERAKELGFDAVATGHHARLVTKSDGTWRLARGADAAKDQSYVLYMLGQERLERLMLPLGAHTKTEVRARAAELGLRTANKPDSQDVCFITSTRGGRQRFLGDRLTLTPGRVIDSDGSEVGTVTAVELVTIGQRKGLGMAGGAPPRYVTKVDTKNSTVTVGDPAELLVAETHVGQLEWADTPFTGEVVVQVSAHGAPAPASFAIDGEAGSSSGVVTWVDPHRRVAPGQSVVLYDGDEVQGGGIAS